MGPNDDDHKCSALPKGTHFLHSFLKEELTAQYLLNLPYLKDMVFKSWRRKKLLDLRLIVEFGLEECGFELISFLSYSIFTVCK